MAATKIFTSKFVPVTFEVVSTHSGQRLQWQHRRADRSLGYDITLLLLAQCKHSLPSETAAPQ